MSVSVALVPEIPIPGRPVAVFFSLGAPSANYLRLWCTGAPEGSTLANRIRSSSASRVLVYEGFGGRFVGERINPWRFTFDRGGAYSFLGQQYTKSGGWGGGYEGDPRGAPTETKVPYDVDPIEGKLYEEPLTLYVAQRVTQELGVGSDKATLVLYVVNSTIRETIAAAHGEATPAIINPTSDRAKIASQTAAVTAAVATLVTPDPYSVDAALGDLGILLSTSLLIKFVDHAGDAAFHETADDQSDLEDHYINPSSLGGVARSLNKLRTRLALHMQNSQESDPDHPEYQLPGGILIHAHDGTQLDLRNTLLPITADENNPSTLYAAAGDFWRAYEAHRVASMHETADNTNTLSATSPQILTIHREFMTSLAASSPTAPPGQSSGAAKLIGRGGFKEG